MKRLGRKGASWILAVLVSAVCVTGHAAPQGKGAQYGKKVTAPKGQAVTFPDFTLRPLGMRVVQPENTAHLIFWDFELESGPVKQVVSWGGLGNIAPQPFCFRGQSYELEKDSSYELGDLADDQIVVWKRKTAPDCRFRIVILRTTLEELGGGADYATFWPRLRERAAAPAPAMLYVEASDVESYDPAGQTLRIGKWKTEYLGDEDSKHDLDGNYAGRPVMVTVEGEPVFGAVLLKVGSPAPPGLPVLRADLSGEQAVLRIEAPEALAEAVRDRRIETVFRALGTISKP